MSWLFLSSVHIQATSAGINRYCGLSALLFYKLLLLLSSLKADHFSPWINTTCGWQVWNVRVTKPALWSLACRPSFTGAAAAGTWMGERMRGCDWSGTRIAAGALRSRFVITVAPIHKPMSAAVLHPLALRIKLSVFKGSHHGCYHLSDHIWGARGLKL